VTVNTILFTDSRYEQRAPKIEIILWDDTLYSGYKAA